MSDDATEGGLLPCPWCGGTPRPECDGPQMWAVYCPCGAHGPYAETQAEAVAAWNRRAPAAVAGNGWRDDDEARVREAAAVLLALTPTKPPAIGNGNPWSRAMSVAAFELNYALAQERTSNGQAWEVVRDTLAALAAPTDQEDTP